MKACSQIKVFISISLLIIMGGCNSRVESISAEIQLAPKTTIILKDTPLSSEQTADYAALGEIGLAHEVSASIDELLDNLQVATEAQDENAEYQALVELSQSSRIGTEELIQIYIAFYAEISPESIILLSSIQDDLDGILSILDEISATTNPEASEIVEFNEQLEQILMRTFLKEKVQTWPMQVQSQIDERQNTYALIQPEISKIAYHRVGAFTQTYEFLDAFQDALEDGKFSPDELLKISQYAANARASLYSTGDPQLFDIPAKIDVLTNLAIQGRWAEAQDEIVGLQRLLPARPQP